MAILVAADLARYVNELLTIKLNKRENFLQGHHFSDLLIEHTNPITW